MFHQSNSNSNPNLPDEDTNTPMALTTSSQASSSAATSPSRHLSSHHTINLRIEYTRSLQTDSYQEIWSKIEHHDDDGDDVVDGVLQPDRSSIQEALSSARETPLTRLVSQYFDSSENASHHFLALRRAVVRARSIYSPITDLIEHLPSPDHQFSDSQCDWAVNTLQEFDGSTNPFPAPISPEETTCNFDSMRCCFLELKQLLDSRLFKARRRHKLLRLTTRGSGVCLVVSVVAAAATGFVIAGHALVALAAVGPAMCNCGGRDLLSRQRRRLREYIMQVDKASRETYALNSYLDTIERLVARLYSTLESDKTLVRLGLERGQGKGQRHSVQEVVRHLRKNHSSFLKQLRDLDVQIVLCLAAVNRARSLLIHQIHC